MLNIRSQEEKKGFYLQILQVFPINLDLSKRDMRSRFCGESLFLFLSSKDTDNHESKILT